MVSSECEAEAKGPRRGPCEIGKCTDDAKSVLGMYLECEKAYTEQRKGWSPSGPSVVEGNGCKMGPYLYVTLLTPTSDSGDYLGIVVEDVKEDYAQVVEFASGDFSRDVFQYLAWVDEHLERDGAAEIYESEELQERIRQSHR